MIGKRYIGDGVYVEVSEGSLLLTTDRRHSCVNCDHDMTITHSIYLDPQMIDEFVKYYNEAKRAATEEKTT